MNYKDIGTIGENCVIGELSKYGLGIAPVLSDNYPFEMIAITDNKLFRVQVKTSTQNKNNEYISFDLRTNNWYKGTSKKYTEKDCDIIILYDLVEHKCFLLSPKDFSDKGSFTIRYKKQKTNNGHGINWHEDYIISNKRIKEIFDFEVPDLKIYFATQEKKYTRTCQECGEIFEHNYKNVKYCSSNCRGIKRRKVERPSKKELEEMIKTTPLLRIGRSYGVSDNAVRKWARKYELI